MLDLEEMIYEAYKLGASDLHLSVGVVPTIRLHGELRPFGDMEPLTSESLAESLDHLMETKGIKQRMKTMEKKELDFSFSIKNEVRVRTNLYFERNEPAAAFRMIPRKIKTLEDLGLPSILKEMCEHDRGFILVVGPTGSGKSTTLAAMIDYINSSKPVHILTIEDPIEYIHDNKVALIHQREVGQDTESFADGLKYALRQDPDVILVGEMRDLETMELALTAAETGHLVFATVHTNSAPQTPERIIGAFPPHQQNQIAVQLANTLVGIVYQRLVPRADMPGRVAVLEILIANNAIKNLVREMKFHQIESIMQASGRMGMVTFDDALFDAYRRGLISKENLKLFARNLDYLQRRAGVI
ncbi:MAG: twitching motility protein PilT [Thermotogota bacterium]|nr:twitching motility protein PilT [Thermotogota bacterium]MDK2863812.1 twitching motility protein PilT [Thermotogota bacterium]